MCAVAPTGKRHSAHLFKKKHLSITEGTLWLERVVIGGQYATKKALTFFLDLLRHQELIPLNRGGVVAADDSHRILELVGHFSWRRRKQAMTKKVKRSTQTTALFFGPPKKAVRAERNASIDTRILLIVAFFFKVNYE